MAKSGVFRPNVVKSKWTTRRAAGSQVEREYLVKSGLHGESPYFNKQCNRLLGRFRYKRSKKILPKSFCTVSVCNTAAVKVKLASAGLGVQNSVKKEAEGGFADEIVKQALIQATDAIMNMKEEPTEIVR